MSTLSTYTSYLTQKLSSSSDNYWDVTKKTNAINWAIQEFTDEYKPEELRRKATVITGADPDGDYLIATLPTGVTSAKQIIRLWVPDSGVMYEYADPEEYYESSGNIWTVDYSETNAAQRIFIKTLAVIGTLKAHFIIDPGTLSDSADESNINSKADELISLMAAEKLLTEAREYEAAQGIANAKKEAVRAWQGKYGNVARRLKSKYERTGYLSRS